MAIVVAGVLGVVVVGAQQYTWHVAYDAGFVAAKNVPWELMKWAMSERGQQALKLDRANWLGPLTVEQIDWLTGIEGSQFYRLGRLGLLGGIGKEEVEWLQTQSRRIAVELDEDGHLDSRTYADLSWVRGRPGQLAREIDDAGLLDGLALEKLRWVENWEVNRLFRMGYDVSLATEIQFVAQCDADGGRAVCR